MVATVQEPIRLRKPRTGLMSGSVIGFVARVSGSFGSLLSGMVLARMLSPSDFGIYTLLYNVVVVAAVLGTFGVGDAAIRFVGYSLGSGATGMAARTAKQALVLGALGMLAVALVFPVVRSLVVRWDPHFSIGGRESLLVAGWIFSYGLLVHSGYLLRAFNEITPGTVTESLLYRVGVVLAFGVAFAVGQRSLISVLVVSTLVATASAIVALRFFARVVNGLRSLDHSALASPGRSIYRWKELLGVGLPLYGSTVLFRLMSDGTIFVVDHFHGVGAVALYGVAYRFWAAFSLPQIAVDAALQPQLAICAATNDSKGMEALQHEAILLGLLPTGIFTIISLVAGGPLLSLLYGQHYAQGASVLAILSISQLLSVLLGPSEHLMSMTGRHMAVFYVTVVSALISLILAWTLTPSLGLAGAAIAAGLSNVVFKALLAVLAHYQLGVRTVLPFRAIHRRQFDSTTKAR